MAFANSDEFWKVQRRVESIELSFAMGQDTPELEKEYEQLRDQLDQGGWTIDMDTAQAVPIGDQDGK